MLLSTLAEHAIKEGSEVTVSRMNLEAHEVEVVVGGRPLTLTSDAAKLIWVEIN
jgi:Fe2+ transport system protein FeoA